MLAALLAALLSLAELAAFSYRQRRRSSGSWLRLCLAELKTAMRSNREISSPVATAGPPTPVAMSPLRSPPVDKIGYKEEAGAGEDSVRERLLYRKVEEDRVENSRL